MADTTTKIDVKIEPDPGFKLMLDELRGTEELGRPFLYELSMSSTEAKGDLTALLGSTITVTVVQPGGSTRHFNGIIGRIAYAGMRSGARSYRIELRPWLWLLSHRRDCRIFQNKSAWDIITTVCRNAGFSDFEDKRQKSAGSETLEYCVQYDESTFDFVTRLMEEFGIYYYFEHSDGKHTVKFADDPSSHSAIGAAIPFRTRQTNARAVADHIWQWSSELAVVPGKVTFTDYNFTTSAADLTARSSQVASHKYGDFEVFAYPGLYPTAADGQKLTDVRVQDLAARRHVLFGTSNSRRLYTGCKFTLDEFYEESENTEYTVIRATYTLSVGQLRAAAAGASRSTYRCDFEAIKGTTPFRLNRITPHPLIRGPQTAKVVGEPTGSAADEIVTDQYGRVKVRFYWARPDTPATQSAAEQNDQKASCWIRVAQIWAGATWGGMFIPRVGQEVVVEFLEGNPDRPIITGCVYNDAQKVPYALPDNKTRSTIKTNSSTGGGGFNELRFEDKKDSEEVFFQAQKDYNKKVLNNETVTITQDTTTTVEKGNRSVTVSEGNNSLTVSKGNNSATVSEGNNSTTVSQGNNSTTVSEGNNSLTVSQGKNTVVVQSDNSLTVNEGNHTITITAGSSTISAGQSITIKANEKITLQVGASSITISQTGVSISGPEVTASADATMSLKSNAEMSLNGGGAMILKAGEILIN